MRGWAWRALLAVFCAPTGGGRWWRNGSAATFFLCTGWGAGGVALRAAADAMAHQQTKHESRYNPNQPQTLEEANTLRHCGRAWRMPGGGGVCAAASRAFPSHARGASSRSFGAITLCPPPFGSRSRSSVRKRRSIIVTSSENVAYICGVLFNHHWCIHGKHQIRPLDFRSSWQIERLRILPKHLRRLYAAKGFSNPAANGTTTRGSPKSCGNCKLMARSHSNTT